MPREPDENTSCHESTIYSHIGYPVCFRRADPLNKIKQSQLYYLANWSVPMTADNDREKLLGAIDVLIIIN